jgi:protein phosphatase
MVQQEDLSKSISLVDEVLHILDEQKNYSNRIGHVLKTSPENSYLIVGDLHGDLDGLKILFSLVNIKKHLEIKSNKVIFLGDYVDRGPKQLETLEFVLSLFKSYPKQVILLRGNHEGPTDMPAYPYDFGRNIAIRFKENVSIYLKKIQTLFDSLLLAVIIDGRALLLHGGIPTRAKGLEDIAFAHQRSHLKEILWNDPMQCNGTMESIRGMFFGPDITESFLDSIGVETLIRGHQADPNGYKVDHGRVLTVFSSKNPTHSPRVGSYQNSQRTAILAGKNHSYKIKDLVNDIIFF